MTFKSDGQEFFHGPLHFHPSHPSISFHSYRSGFLLFWASFRITCPWFFHFSKSLIRLSFSSLKPDGVPFPPEVLLEVPLYSQDQGIHSQGTHSFFASFGLIRIRMLLQRLLYQYTLLPTTRRTFVHRNKENKYQLGFVPIFNKNVTIASQVPCTLSPLPPPACCQEPVLAQYPGQTPPEPFLCHSSPQCVLRSLWWGLRSEEWNQMLKKKKNNKNFTEAWRSLLVIWMSQTQYYDLVWYVLYVAQEGGKRLG